MHLRKSDRNEYRVPPENMEKADELNLFQTVCLDLVKSSADILDRLL